MTPSEIEVISESGSDTALNQLSTGKSHCSSQPTSVQDCSMEQVTCRKKRQNLSPFHSAKEIKIESG